MFKPNKKTGKFLASAVSSLVISSVFLSGCGSVDTNTPNETSSLPTQLVSSTLYYPSGDASALVAETRQAELPDVETVKIMYMFKALEQPAEGINNPIPAGTKMLGATVENGVLTLNLSKEFKDNFTGGSAQEQMTIYSIVNTLTTLPDIKSVQFQLEGQVQDAILGHIATNAPILPNNQLIQS